MKRFSRLFKEAERLPLPPGLWREIEAGLGAGAPPRRSAVLWTSPGFRMAAAAAFAFGLLGAGWLRSGRQRAPAAAVPGAPITAEIVDAELWAWSAELGELELESDDGMSEEGEML